MPQSEKKKHSVGVESEWLDTLDVLLDAEAQKVNIQTLRAIWYCGALAALCAIRDGNGKAAWMDCRAWQLSAPAFPFSQKKES